MPNMGMRTFFHLLSNKKNTIDQNIGSENQVKNTRIIRKTKL